jgi:CHAT domain-containing protein
MPDSCGEGLTGLARAFFAAGAHSLLVSHWRVRDDVASRLTVRTVELMRRTPTLRAANALRRAMADIAADPTSDTMAISLAHPAIWGAFMIVGAD